MRERLAELEKISRLLEPTSGKRDEVRKKIIDYSEHFLNRIEKINAFNLSETNGARLLDFPIGDEPLPAETIIELLREEVDEPALNPASGGHLGYIPGGGIYYSALGDYLADVFNRYAGVFYAGPGAVRMENLLLKWTASIMGYPEDAAGNLTSGGSMANLIGIVCARDASLIKARDYDKAIIYATEQAHHSIDKAIRIAGLKEAIIRKIPVDEQYRMRTDLLDRAIKVDLTNRLLPFLVIGSAGTTDVGAVDPLGEIATIAQRYHLWFHVDAAYGGYFILTDEGKEKLKGIEQSDSLAVDPHKGLFLPYGTGIVMVKDAKQLRSSHRYSAAYLQDAASAVEEISPADLSPELTKHFRGLRLWLPLKLLGVKPFKACLEEKLLLAKYFYKEVKKLGFKVGNEPELSVVTYRYIPVEGDANEFNKKLMEAVIKDGRVFISSTTLEGNLVLRAAILSFRTHLSTIDTLLAVLKESVEKLSA